MGSKTNTTTSSTSPPAALLAQYQDLINRGVTQSQTGAAPYGADTSLQQQGYSGISSVPGQYLPQAESYAEQGGAPITAGEIGNYTNPFQQDVTNATEANINETNAEQQNQITGNAIAQGALGGNRVGVAQGELARQQGLANNATYAGLNATNYDQALQAAQADRSAAGSTAGTFAGLEGTALQGAAAQLGAGTQQQSYSNQTLQWPYQDLSWLSGIEGQTGPLEGSSSSQTQPAPNILSQILGGGLALAGLPGGSLGGSFLTGLGLKNGGIAVRPHFASGGIAVRPHFAPGGVVTPMMAGRPPMGNSGGQPPGNAAGIVANAVNLARTMKSGMGSGGIGAPHFDDGGAVPYNPFTDVDPSLFQPSPQSAAASAAIADMGPAGIAAAPSILGAAMTTPTPVPPPPQAAPDPSSGITVIPPAATAPAPGIAAPSMPAPRTAPSAPGIGAPAIGSPTPLSGDLLTRAGAAIASNETGGQKDPYSYVEPTSGALGKYQVMPENVAPWTKQVLGRAMTPQQFLADPQAQEAVFKGIFGQYLQQSGDPSKAAAMWFGGPGVNANTGPDALGTTVAGYVQKFNDALNGGAAPSAGGIATPQTATLAMASDPTAAGAGAPAATPGIGHGQLIKAFLSRPGNQALTDVGLGILGGTSPFFGTNVGQGAMQGLDMDRQLQQLKAQIGYQQGMLGINAEKADTAAAKPVVIGHDQFGQSTYGVPNPSQPGTFIQTDLLGNQTGNVLDTDGNITAVGGEPLPTLLPATDPGYATTPIVGGMTSAAIDQAARSYLTTGQLPTAGSRGAAGAMTSAAIKNAAAAIAPDGVPAANKAQFQSLSHALTQQQTYLGTTQRAFNTANDTLNGLIQYMKDNNINPSQYPDFNSLSNAVKAKVLDPGVVAGYQARVATLQSEYAQVVSRGGQVTDAARSHADQLIPNNLDPAQLQKVYDSLQYDGTNVIKDAQQQIDKINGQIGDITKGGDGSAPDSTPAPAQAAASATPAPAPATGTVAHPATKADYDALPKGTQYVDPQDGKTYVKQ